MKASKVVIYQSKFKAIVGLVQESRVQEPFEPNSWVSQRHNRGTSNNQEPHKISDTQEKSKLQETNEISKMKEWLNGKELN